MVRAPPSVISFALADRTSIMFYGYLLYWTDHNMLYSLVWRNIRRTLAYYLDYYTFRFNRRTSRYRGKLFYRLLQNAVVIDPVRYDDMIMAVTGPIKKHKI